MKIISRVRLPYWLVFYLITALQANAFVVQQADKIPEPVVPVYEKLKDLHLTTHLVERSAPSISILTPSLYEAEASSIQEAIKQVTGITIPVMRDNMMRLPLEGNFILLGNRSTNEAISELYDRAYTFLDLKYPGAGGFVVRSLHNPLGNGKNVLFAGGSDIEGVRAATAALIKHIEAAGGKSGSLSVNHLAEIRLGKDYVVPGNVKEAEIWEASERYKSTGYFGWNMISKNMALYYMTGEQRFLNEFVRLSFTDEEIIREIDLTDGELIENKTDPLAGPYHYAAHMMIEMWDLIEESPLLTDELRLRITNAFARQLTHRVAEGIYLATKPAASLGGRHGDWSAFSLYALGRYFEKDYPSPVWNRCLQAADQYFSTLKNTSWMGSHNDHLFWFTSYYDPLLNYLLLSGNRDPEMMANLRSGLNTQQVISTGKKPDWGLNTSSLSMLNKAAYILNEGRWLYYREQVQLDTDVFRLGQSFWPAGNLRPASPGDQVGRWNMQWMPKEMREDRKTGFSSRQSFRWGSYRSELGSGGDYVLLKGYNGAGRNPYHTFDILELRLNGATLLKGYHNQVLTSANGMVEPKVAMDAALLHHDVIGEVSAVVAQVPDLPFVDWRRSLTLRKGRYALIVDDLRFRSDNENILAEFTWEMPGATRMPSNNGVKIQPTEKPGSTYALHSSELLQVQDGKTTTMQWQGAGRKGERKIFFHLLGEDSSSATNELASLALTPNAAVVALPEAGIVALGNHEGLSGDLVILTEKSLYGHALTAAGLSEPLFNASVPVSIDWDFINGNISINSSEPVTLTFALAAPGVMSIRNKAFRGKPVDGRYTFELPAGRQDLTRAFPSPEIQERLSKELKHALQQAHASRKDKSAVLPVASASGAAVIPVMKGRLDGRPTASVIIPSKQGDLLGIASGKNVSMLNAAGREVRRFSTTGEVRVLHWWAAAKLLLVGCDNEKVYAFDAHGVKKWEFTSVMDPAVFESGKQYWFKTAYPGIHGLSSGVFDEGKSRAFVGSAGTIEILDYNGQLVGRMPVFWGNPREFLLLDAADGSRNLLAARWQSDRPNFAIVNSRKLEVERFGYDGVPEGHTFVNGWMVMNRLDNFYADLDGDGKKEIVSAINGIWNRVTVYSETGKPMYNVQIGPGSTAPRSNIRMMDVGDISGGKEPEVILGLSSGHVNVLNGQLKTIWSRQLSSPPVVVKLMKGKGMNWLCTGSEDGTILAIDAVGNVLKRGNVKGRPVDVQLMQTPKGAMAVIISDSGDVFGFRLDAPVHEGKSN